MAVGRRRGAATVHAVQRSARTGQSGRCRAGSISTARTCCPRSRRAGFASLSRVLAPWASAAILATIAIVLVSRLCGPGAAFAAAGSGLTAFIVTGAFLAGSPALISATDGDGAARASRSDACVRRAGLACVRLRATNHDSTKRICSRRPPSTFRARQVS